MTKEELIRIITDTPKPFSVHPIKQICAEKELMEYEQQIRAEIIDEVLKKISKVIPFLNNDQLTAYFNICDKICELKEQNK